MFDFNLFLDLWNEQTNPNKFCKKYLSQSLRNTSEFDVWFQFILGFLEWTNKYKLILQEIPIF